MFTVFVDESGDEGFRFDAGSSQWLVLSAVVVRKATDPSVELCKSIKQEIGLPENKTMHFVDLNHDKRVVVAARVGAAQIRTVSILVHKPSLAAPETFADGSRLYFYATRFLLERVSWLCRDSNRGDGCEAEIIFEHRSSLSYGELRGYLMHLRENSEAWQVSVDWNVIAPDEPARVRALPKRNRAGLQLADAVAASLFQACEVGRYGFTEDRYARLLAQAVYTHRGSSNGYGVKFWPATLQQAGLEGTATGWLLDYPGF